jgi:hypothetical protein
MTRPSVDELYREAAEVAYRLHCPLQSVLDLEHGDRRRFLSEAKRLAAAR